MIWAGFILITLLVLAVFLWRGDASDNKADPVALYKRQLADIERDKTNGVLDEGAAEAARLEIERRILRVGQGGTVAGEENKAAPLLLAVFAVAGASIFYYMVGNPTMPASQGRMISVQDAPVEEGGPTFREAIERVEEHLQTSPEDQKGWEILAKSARSVGDFSRAATAFGKLTELEPENSDWRIQQLESFVIMGGGQVSPAAKLVLQQLLTQEPNHPGGHYYLGLVRRQAGDDAGAKAVWTALADRSAPNAPWMPALRERLGELGVQPPKLSAEQMDAVSQMTEEERTMFVESMIERLESRLESEPNDPQGWLMLARSLLAMKGQEAAIASLRAGIQAVGPENALELQAFLDNLLSKADP